MSLSVSPQDLREIIHSGARTIILDCRYHRGIDSRTQYAALHIPQALFCNPVEQLAGWPSREAGRYPLPELGRLGDSVRAWGLTPETPVVVYDEGDCLFAARVWWVLRWAGVQDVRILIGGLTAWEAAGYDIIGGPGNLPTPSRWSPEPGHMRVAEVADVAQCPQHGVLVDARDPERFNGVGETIHLQAGHIPGAVNLPVAEVFDRATGFAPAEVVRARFESVGATDPAEVILYSGAALDSSLAMAAMHNAGLAGAAHFVGGWSQWSGDPRRPIIRK